MEMLVDNKSDLVEYNEQLGNSKIDFDKITETAQDIDQNLDNGIKSCEVTVVSEHNMDINIKSIENSFSDSVVGVKDYEEDIESNYTLIIENVQERNDKHESCKDKESIGNEIIEFLEKKDNDIERFENIDVQDASQSSRSEKAVKEDTWMMSNKGVEQDSHLYVEKSQNECWNSASGAPEDVQLSPSNDRATQILQCPVSVRLEISAGNEFSYSGNENTSGSNSDQQENDLLEKLDEQYCSIDILEEHKKLSVSEKEFKTVGDLEGWEVPYSSQLEQVFPMASEASHGDVGKEKTVQNANRNMCHSSTNKCSVCGKVCLGQARMVSHMRVHSGERPFDCKICGLNFKYKENLKRHQKMHKSSKQTDSTSPNFKQMYNTLEQRKRSNSYYLGIHGLFQSSVVKSRDEVMCMPQTENIKSCSAANNNFADTNVCKETEFSASVKEYVNSHCRILKEDERKLISSVDKVLSTTQKEQSVVEIFACSVVLDKINLQEQNTEVYLKHHTKEKLTTNITPVQIPCPQVSPINSKTNADKEGSPDRVERNDPLGEDVFKCPLCNKSYSHKRSLDKHKRHVHPNLWHQETVLSVRSKRKIFMSKYKCDICAFRFFSSAGLIRHQNKFCSMKLTDCSEENKTSSSQSNQKVRGKEAQVLDYEYSRLRQLRQNVFSSSEIGFGSGNEKTNICRFCGRMFSRRINLHQHEQMHIRKKLNAVKSEVEQESFSSTSQTGHAPVNSDELSNASKQHKCKFCGRMFSRRINLHQHEQVHIRERLNPTKLQAEHQSFSLASQNHESPVNSDKISDNSKTHKCKFCGRMFSRRINLIQHEQVHKRRKQVKMVLDEGYPMESDDNKRSKGPVKNIFKLSSAQMNHKCRFCSRKFFRRCNLCQHEPVCYRRQIIRKQNPENSNRNKTHNSSLKKVSVCFVKNPLRVISNNKFNSCRYCRKIFSTKSNLNRHVKLHKQKKKFFKQKNNSSNGTDDDSLYAKRKSAKSIRNQVRIISTDNLHPCQYCGKWFPQELDLSKHLKLHSQESTQLEHGNTVYSSSSVKNNLRMDTLGSGQNVNTSESDQNIKRENINKTPHICRFCGRLFARRTNLCQHEPVCHRRQIIQKQNPENYNRIKTQNSISKKVPVGFVESPQRVIFNNKFNSCQYCRKIFSTKSNLNRHVKLHKQKKKFFRQKNNSSNRTDDSLYAKRKSAKSIRNQVRNISTDNQHPCQYCGKWFPQELDLSEHLKLHSQESTQLEHGNTVYSSSSVKNNLHMDTSGSGQLVNTSESDQNIKRENINKTPHICRFCGRLFARRTNLCQHEPVCHRRQIIQKQNPENSNRIKTHNSSSKKVSVSFVENPQRVISNNKFNSCQYCRKIFSTKSNLNRHIKLHKQKKKFFKQKNNISNRTDDSLYAKRRSPKSIRNQVRNISTDNRHPCQYCGKWFPQELDLSQHLELHSQESTQLAHRNTVYSSSSVKNNLHMDTSGSGQIVNTLESDQNIKRENINKTPHICRFCGRLFARRINLCQHEPVCHRRQIIRKQKPEKSSRTKTHSSNSKKVSVSSVENPRRVISNSKFNICQYCRKCFSNKSNLNRHVKLHEQKKKFLQQKRNNSRRSYDNLYAKRKSQDSITNRVKIDATHNRHSCQNCGKWFFHKLDLSQHLKLHSQESTQLEHGNNLSNASSVTTDLHTNTSESAQNIKKENLSTSLHICRFCGRLFARRLNLCQHERVCHRRQIIRKQNPENSNKNKTHNSSLKKVSVSFVENPLRVISNNNFNSCQYCRKIFSTKSNLNRHVKLHEQNKKFFKQKNNSSKRTDDSIYSKRKSAKSIRNQVRIISTDNRHPCQYCGKWFPQKLDLSQHLKSHSQKSTQLEHGNNINSSSSVTTDLHTDTSESDQNIKKENLSKTPHICRFCGRLFARRTNLCQHEQWHKQKDGKGFKEDNKKAIHSCRICGRHFERRVNLCQHERCHSRKNIHLYRREMFESKPFQAKRKNRCLVCSKICTNKSDLLLHYESRHTEDLRCQICNTLVGTYVHLRKHMRTHVEFGMVDMKELSHDQRAKYTNAAHFPKKAKVGKRSQVTEESYKAAKSKKYKCTLCAMGFNTPSLLFLHKKKHMMSAHACFVCGKIFTRKFDLARHLRIHTGDQPHECDICLKGFRCRLNLSDHMGTHVLKEANEFQCDGCKALFFDQQSILNHLESAHTSHHKVSHLGTQIIHNNNELQGNEHGLGRENFESDSVINFSQSKKPIFSCGICGEVYEEASHLYLHMGNHVNESVENENGEETGITVKAESCSPNRQMDNQHSCKLENRSSHNDMQNSQGHVCLSDFVDTIKNKTSFVSVVSSLDGEVNTFDHATESLTDEYIDDGIDDTVDDGIDEVVDHSESVSKFLNVNRDNEIDERTISVDSNAANIGDITKILDCTEMNKKFKCGLCMHMFSSKQGLSQHKRWHASTDVKISKMKKDFCSVCKIYFSSKSSFTLHLNWHKSGLAKKVVISDKINIPLKPYRCEKCGKTFTRKDSLGKHKCMMHYSQNKSRSKVVMSKGIMKTVPNGFICEVCGCSYAQRACLVQHLLYKHNLAEKNFEAVCDEKEKPLKCQRLLNIAGLTSHNPKYQKGNQNPKYQKGNQNAYKCIFCRKQYIKRHAYLLHTSRAHPNYYQQVLGKMTEESSNKKKCKYCKNWYNSNDNTGHKDEVNCKSCETIFPCKGCFIQHLDLQESSELEGWFWCCVCQIKFSNRNELKKHVPLHASDLGRYNCRICRQIFKYKQHLFRHEKVHGMSLQYSLKNSYACEWRNKESTYDAMHLHQKTNFCTDHKTSRKSKKRQVQVNAKSYNCTNITNVAEVNMVSPAGVGSDIFSSLLPRQDDQIAQDVAYHPNETISNQGKDVTSNLGSLEAFPVSIKQELIDLCDNSFCGSTCTSPVEELENNGFVHNSDFDTSIQDSPFLNRVGSDATKFDFSPAVQPNERVKQDDIQSSFEDSEQDEVDIDDIHDSNSSPIDRSDMLYLVKSTMETGQNDSLALLKEVLEKPSYSEAHLGHKSPPGLFKAAHFKDMKDFDEQQGSTELIPQMESSNKNDNFHSLKPSDNSDDKANDTSKEDLSNASNITSKCLKQTEHVLRKDTSDNFHYQEHQIVKDNESTTPGIYQECKEQRVRCIICCKTVYPEELVRHLQSHADLKLYECEHCNECFLSAMSYSEHMEKNYGEIICCACGETFTEKKDLIMHVRKHNFDVVLNCSICGAVFTSHDTFLKHLEFHVLSEAKSAETQNDSDDSGSRDIEIISSEDREEEEENLRALMEDQEDAEKTMSSVITSTAAAWKQMSLTLLSDAASSEVDEAADIKPDIHKLNDTMWIQNAYKNMETIMGCNQTILDRMVQNSLCQVRADPINTVSGTPLNWYSMWKKLSGKITGSEHRHLYDRCQKEHCQADTSTSFNMFPIRTEPREPEKVPVIKTEFFEQDTQLLIEESERPRTTGRAGLMQSGLKPCFVKIEKIDCMIFTCSLCLRLFVNENALKRHYLLHLIPGYKFS